MKILKLIDLWKHASRIFLLLLLPFLAACDQEPLIKHVVYSVFAPPGHPVARNGLTPWLQSIEDATNQEIKTRLYPGASIVGKGTVSALRMGLIDGGLVANIYTPDELPVSMITTNLGFFNRNSLATAGAINEFMLLQCPECEAEYAKHGIVNLGTYAASSYKLMCKQIIQSSADLHGLKIRTAGPVFGRWIQLMGAVPVNMSNSHAYEALERGMLDCVMGSTAWLKSLSLWDMTNTIVDMPMGTFFGGSLFNFTDDKWQQFSKEQKQVILRLTPKGIADTVIAYRTESSSAEAASLDRGLTKISGDKALFQLLDAYKDELLQHSIEVAKSRGVINAAEIADRFLITLNKWENLIGDQRWDNERYAELIWQQIHSKYEIK